MDWKTYKKRGATQGLSRRSPILVLLSPKDAYLRSSDGIRCISAGMIAHVVFCVLKACMPSVVRKLISFYPKRAEKVTNREVQHEDIPGGHFS